MKRCPKCKRVLNETDFHNNKSKHDGLSAYCRECNNRYELLNKKKKSESHKRYYRKNRDKIIKKSKDYVKNNREKVRIAKKKYWKENRERLLLVKEKYRENHRDELRKKAREYYYKNREQILKKTKERYIKNKDKIQEYQKKYFAKNKEKVLLNVKKYRDANRPRISAYQKERMQVNPKYRLEKNISAAIWYALKHKKNNIPWKEFVEFTLQELILHLEKQFGGNVTWDTYGTYWHLDHIIPLNCFDYENSKDYEFKLAWNLNNLQPLEAVANSSKHDRIILENIVSKRNTLNILIDLLIHKGIAIKNRNEITKMELKQYLMEAEINFVEIDEIRGII